MLVRILYSFIVVLKIFCAVNGHTFKSSLVFVIDRTNSMQYVIKNVINETDMIFEAVLKSNSSIIEDFILVAFDDPKVELLTKTTDRNNFKKALHSIKIKNGYDCPEYSMSGIEAGLNFSKPNSFLYVFTNAFAKDYTKIDAVRSLSQEKGIQVNFLLTGACQNRAPIEYNVYEDITKATSGQIFHSDKEDVNKIINYIVESIKYKRTVLKRTETNEGENKIKFSVDSKIRNVLIAVSSKYEVNYTLTDLVGNVIETESIVQTSKCDVGKVILKPGTYTVLIDENNKTSSVVISGETTVCFQYGFSTTKSATLNETSTKPIDSTENQYLSIELDNVERDVQLETVDLTDIDDNIIQVLTLTLVNEEQQFYVTESFKPPSGMFKIAVNGLTKTKEKIRRVSTSTTQYQNPKIEPVPPYTPPTVTITPESPVFVEPDDLLTLKCLVHGYPEPDIKWTDDSGEIFTPKPMYTIHLRRLYASVLEITKPSKNMTVSCTAISEKGDKDSKSIDVKIKHKIYLKVLEYPKDKNVEYKENIEFKCKVDSWPAATITWLRKNKIISSDENFIISPDSSTLTIQEVNTRLKGEYSVNVSNTYETKVFSFQVKVPNLKAPKIDKENSIYARTIGDNVTMTCRIIQGEPKPSMTWSFNKDGSHDYEDLKNAQDFYYIDKINEDHSGIYRCEAINEIDKDFHEMELVLKRPPSVKMPASVTFKEGERVRLDCIVDGSPIPSVRWRFKGVKIEVSSRYKIYKNNSLSFIGKTSDSGNYHCVAKNSEGETDAKTTVIIYQPLRIESPEETVFNLNVGESIKLYCNVSGYPIPKVEWWLEKFEGKYIATALTRQKNKNLPYDLKRFQTYDEGKYTCVAENGIEKISIQYEVHVLVAPKISRNPTTPLLAVVGDKVRSVSCPAGGSPKPTITWYKNGLVLAKGEFYDFDGGKLIIKYPDFSSQGTYVCNASNTVGYDTAEYDVIVNEYIDDSYFDKIEVVNEGSTRNISCNKNSQTVDARWFKDGRFYKNGDTIELQKAKRSDSGIYICRINAYYPYNSPAKKVIVGSKPEFTSNAPTIIQFKDGATEILDCEARGYPEPTIKWRKDLTPLNETSMLYKLTMTKENIGTYSCELRNEFDSIKRIFKIRSEACHLPKANYYGENMPLILSQTRQFITQRTIGLRGNIFIHCPNSLLIYNDERLGSYVSAKCINETRFLINDKEYDISNIKCKEKIEPQYYKTNSTCAPGNTELVQVRFELKSQKFSVFDVCIDKDKYKIHFVRYIMYAGLANTSLAGASFSNDKLLPLNFNDIYNCDYQLKSIYATTGEIFSKDANCCFGKRQLVSPMDVLPGVMQETTYTYLNVVPVWSSCGQENWDEVERRVRSLVYGRDYALYVWTGSSHSIILESETRGSQVELSLNDRYNFQQKVPLYLWKVISDSQEMSSLAVVLINYPNLKFEQASYLAGRICTDICDKTDWMKNSEWKKPNKGFVFCCKINDFEKAFNYKYLFKGRSKILKG